MSRKGVACAFLIAQAVAVAVWWLVLWRWPATREAFVLAPGWPESTLLAFALPDLLCIVGGSLGAAVGLRSGAPWARSLLLLVAGAVGYATLWCVGGNLVTGSGLLCTALMLGSAAGTGWAVVATRP